MSNPTGRVVAELGRPETPQETAERKARDRALRRSRQTWRNLVASLLACVGLVAVIFFAVPRSDAPRQPSIDVTAAVQQYADTAGQPLVAPKVPSTWKANAAQLRGSGDETSWYIGYVIGGSAYAGVTEGVPGTTGLLDDVLDGAQPTGTTTIGGLPWRVYDRRTANGDTGNVAYGLATKIGDAVIAVYGTATAPQLRQLAASVAADAAARGLDGAGTLP